MVKRKGPPVGEPFFVEVRVYYSVMISYSIASM